MRAPDTWPAGGAGAGGTLRYRGVLRRPPQPGRPVPAASMLFPLLDEGDFASYAALPPAQAGVPVLVSMPEKQALLQRLVELVFAELRPLDALLIAARIPAGARMAERLLAPDVFVVHDVGVELTHLAGEGRRVLTIADGIVRHPVEQGCNQLELEWHGAPPDPGCWDAFIGGVERLGFEREAAART